MNSKSNSPIFSQATFRFLRELADNNERDWFNANKAQYENDVREPALLFIEEMGPAIERISPRFTAIAKRSGGALMRVYRDTRFSKDKTPYKTNVGIQFRHELGKDVHAPGFYLHIEPARCFLGAGIWHPDSSALAQIRARISESPDSWRRAAYGKRFTDVFEFSGDALKRPPRGYDADHRYIEDLKRKDFIAITSLQDSEIKAPELVRTVAGHFGRAKPLMAFLCHALELRF